MFGSSVPNWFLRTHPFQIPAVIRSYKYTINQSISYLHNNIKISARLSFFMYIQVGLLEIVTGLKIKPSPALPIPAAWLVDTLRFNVYWSPVRYISKYTISRGYCIEAWIQVKTDDLSELSSEELNKEPQSGFKHPLYTPLRKTSLAPIRATTVFTDRRRVATVMFTACFLICFNCNLFQSEMIPAEFRQNSVPTEYGTRNSVFSDILNSISAEFQKKFRRSSVTRKSTGHSSRGTVPSSKSRPS